VEMIDRFGLLPDASKTLFQVTELKLKAQSLGILKIDANNSGGKIAFQTDTIVDPYSIVKMVQNQPHIFKLAGATQLRFSQTTDDAGQRIDFIKKLLDTLGTTEKKDAA